MLCAAPGAELTLARVDVATLVGRRSGNLTIVDEATFVVEVSVRLRGVVFEGRRGHAAPRASALRSLRHSLMTASIFAGGSVATQPLAMSLALSSGRHRSPP